jgi:hypothetical protein
MLFYSPHAGLCCPRTGLCRSETSLRFTPGRRASPGSEILLVLVFVSLAEIRQALQACAPLSAALLQPREQTLLTRQIALGQLHL